MPTKEKAHMKNGQENGGKRDRKRDEKGRFVPGWPGGPGRGKKAEEDLISEAEEVAADLMKSNDSALRAKGASLALKIQSCKKEELEEDLDSPEAELARKVLKDYIRRNRDEAMDGLDLGLDDE